MLRVNSQMNKEIVVIHLLRHDVEQLLADLAPEWGEALLAAGVLRLGGALLGRHELALLLWLLVAHLSGNVLAASLRNLLGHLLTGLTWDILADLLWNSDALLTGNVDTDLLRHLLGDIAALLLWHVTALLARNVLADLTSYIAALLAWHLDGDLVANIFNGICKNKENRIIKCLLEEWQNLNQI